MKTYVGTKIIDAKPAMKADQDGYRVRYADGYESWSPERAFQDAYQPIEAMHFGHALHCMRAGMRVKRKGWIDTFLMLVPAKNEGVCQHGAYFLRGVKDTFGTKWCPGHEDLIAEDWMVTQ